MPIAENDRVAARPRRLPNGWTVEEVSRSETDFLFGEIVRDATYYSPRVQMEHGTVVDVGANIGLFSLYAHQTWPVSRLIAIEAIPDVREVLRRNVGHIPGIVIPDVAAGAGEDEFEFVYYPEYSMMSGRQANPTDDFALVRQFAEQQLGDDADADVMRHLDDVLRPRFEPEPRLVRTLALAEICAQAGVAGIDLLKVDVEGDELAVLEGLGDVNVRHAVIEVDSRRSSPAAIREALESRGLEVVEVAPESVQSPLSFLFAHSE